MNTTKEQKKEVKKLKKEKKAKIELENFLAPKEVTLSTTTEEESEEMKPFVPTERISNKKATTVQGIAMKPSIAKLYSDGLFEAYEKMQMHWATAGKMSANKRRYLQDMYDKLQDAKDVASIKEAPTDTK
jgi:hypothetical protein